MQSWHVVQGAPPGSGRIVLGLLGVILSATMGQGQAPVPSVPPWTAPASAAEEAPTPRPRIPRAIPLPPSPF